VRGNREYFNFIKAQKFITREEKYLVLSPEVVLLNWSGNVEAELKDGQSFRADPIAISLLFKKMEDSHWKVVYTNESTPIHTYAPK
jgi:ketosteroid isomerase-like protein